ncbi:patatin-like phospholipase family protein [Endozoicomonas euniceicola]|uniref:Patatin family protein n=1 Tax=Endozoicomonas euniceicola TaxID=1234143 RepID=A0ABY6GS38_9GAMM|nr:patatin family protein [Endozoicomonas euniceicola]UYM15558.1 patatin family protein [Endozoicomonas euniceicola]
MQSSDLPNQPKTALIIEGGGMRGVFAAGVLDAFIDKRHKPFSGYYGVSAGALNLISFLSGQRGRNLDIYTGTCLEPNFISLARHIRGGNLFDLDWFFERISKQFTIDSRRFYQTLEGSPMTVVTTCTRTGYPVYHEIAPDTDKDDLFKILKASSALPMIYRSPIHIDERTLMDGSLSDPLPVIKAIEDGFNDLVIIRTRESNYRKTISSGNRLLAWQFRKQPALSSLIRQQYAIYNETLDQLDDFREQGISITEICPETPLNSTRSTRNRNRLVADYHRGYAIGYNLSGQDNSLTE